MKGNPEERSNPLVRPFEALMDAISRSRCPEILTAVPSVRTSGATDARTSAPRDSVLALALRLAQWIGRGAIPMRLQVRLRNWMLSRCDQQGIDKLLSDFRERQPLHPTGTGINLLGYLNADSGLGESARSSLRATEKAGIEVAAVCAIAPWETSRPKTLDPAWVREPIHKINLLHINPEHIVPTLLAMGPSLASRYNIGYWVWETADWPDRWIPIASLVREVWTPSQFSREAIAKKIDRPITVIPHNVAPEVPPGTHRDIPPGEVVFLAMLDFYSLPERKNPVGILEAFRRAFGSSRSGARLILKINNPKQRPDVMKVVQRYVDEMPWVVLLTDSMDRLALNTLLDSCDCYVSLHRSEGFGLPIAEAMYLGKIVIATGWSGNMDFMDEGNSLPVRYGLVELMQDCPPYAKGSVWAEPDLDHAAQLMRLVAEDKEAFAHLGVNATTEIRSRYSAEVSGRLMLKRLNEIVQHDA
jgi:glycosyltransferase involved in cell wall biosynthesis